MDMIDCVVYRYRVLSKRDTREREARQTECRIVKRVKSEVTHRKPRGSALCSTEQFRCDCHCDDNAKDPTDEPSHDSQTFTAPFPLSHFRPQFIHLSLPERQVLLLQLCILLSQPAQLLLVKFELSVRSNRTSVRIHPGCFPITRVARGRSVRAIGV